jgi:hypothetical protein
MAGQWFDHNTIMRSISLSPQVKKIVVVAMAIIIVGLFGIAGQTVRKNSTVRGGLTGDEVKSVPVQSLEQSSEISGGLDQPDQIPNETPSADPSTPPGGLSN